MANDSASAVLILGAGINGCAVARELLLNGVAVSLVDTGDISSGTTARASRLIHGGLRYLEYGEFDLVRESLAERTRLFRLAPQYVHPVRLFIPVKSRFGGLVRSAGRFLGWEGRGWYDRFVRAVAVETGGRGLWLANLGLWLYDAYARDPLLPRHRVHPAGGETVPMVDDRYRWLLSYSDGQMVFPERFVLSMLADARAAGEAQGVPLEVLTYHRARLDGQCAMVEPVAGKATGRTFEPPVIVNATGPWGDFTLRELDIASPTLFGGTKGSHFITKSEPLRRALAGQAVYAEADDGRLVFILPFLDAVLVGTTDIPFEARPETAVAGADELEYLVRMVNEVVPAASMTRSDIALYYSGVRPLPATDASKPGAVTRRHWVETNEAGPVPILTLIGGKLTTARSFGARTCDAILARLGRTREVETTDRPYPGGENHPDSDARLRAEHESLAKEFSLELASIEALWRLLGTRTGPILGSLAEPPTALLDGTAIPTSFARWSIRNEWVERVEDLVERRLMLVYQPPITARCLDQLASLLIEEGCLDGARKRAAIDQAANHLKEHYGISTQ